MIFPRCPTQINILSVGHTTALGENRAHRPPRCDNTQGSLLFPLNELEILWMIISRPRAEQTSQLTLTQQIRLDNSQNIWCTLSQGQTEKCLRGWTNETTSHQVILLLLSSSVYLLLFSCTVCSMQVVKVEKSYTGSWCLLCQPSSCPAESQVVTCSEPTDWNCGDVGSGSREHTMTRSHRHGYSV